MTKKYATGFVAKYRGHWRLGVDEIGKDGTRRRRFPGHPKA